MRIFDICIRTKELVKYLWKRLVGAWRKLRSKTRFLIFCVSFPSLSQNQEYHVLECTPKRYLWHFLHSSLCFIVIYSVVFVCLLRTYIHTTEILSENSQICVVFGSDSSINGRAEARSYGGGRQKTRVPYNSRLEFQPSIFISFTQKTLLLW